MSSGYAIDHVRADPIHNRSHNRRSNSLSVRILCSLSLPFGEGFPALSLAIVRRKRMIRSNKPTGKALPEQLSIGIGGYFGPCCSVTLEKGRLTYRYFRSGTEPSSPKGLLRKDQIKPSDEQWQAFRRALDRLNVWCWQIYSPEWRNGSENSILGHGRTDGRSGFQRLVTGVQWGAS